LPPQLTKTEKTWIDDGNAFLELARSSPNTGSLTPPAAEKSLLRRAFLIRMTAEIRVTGTAVSNVSLSLDNNNMITQRRRRRCVTGPGGSTRIAFGVWLRRRRIPVSV